MPDSIAEKIRNFISQYDGWVLVSRIIVHVGCTIAPEKACRKYEANRKTRVSISDKTIIGRRILVQHAIRGLVRDKTLERGMVGDDKAVKYVGIVANIIPFTKAG